MDVLLQLSDEIDHDIIWGTLCSSVFSFYICCSLIRPFVLATAVPSAMISAFAAIVVLFGKKKKITFLS